MNQNYNMMHPVMRNVQMKGEFILPVSNGCANAVRRALLDDLSTWAPCKLSVEKNTTCQTDEYIAHRIGLVPFKRVGNGNDMIIHVKGRTAWISDIKGPCFEHVHDMEVIEMNEDQELMATITFDENVGSKHARYKMCAAVGIKKLKNDMFQLVFETINEREPIEVLKEAVSKLHSRIDDSLLQLSKI